MYNYLAPGVLHSDRERDQRMDRNMLTVFTAVDNAPTEMLPIASLLPADSPRLVGENDEHTKVLAQTSARLPPIVVNRSSMRVIDGMHRLQAARLRGDTEIEVRFFDGDEDEAFVLSVRANMAHGLPLTLADRTAAATRIIVAYPQWSDRTIALAAGLAAATVAAIRQRTAAGGPQAGRPVSRVGRDGKIHPLCSAEGRRLASVLIEENPQASLREIARGAGISPATARDVRERCKRGEDPVPPRERAAELRILAGQQRVPRRADSEARKIVREPTVILTRLRRDPSLRLNEGGRALLVWLAAHVVSDEDCGRLLGRVPPHSIGAVADVARGCAERWTSFAEALDRRARAVEEETG
jgi:ParB-like chromosome segregation protein Spo0J